MHLLEKRDYTEKELRQKLTAGKTEYTQEEMDIAIDYVKSFHYVDDGKYACKYIEAMRSRKSRSRLFIICFACFSMFFAQQKESAASIWDFLCCFLS